MITRFYSFRLVPAILKILQVWEKVDESQRNDFVKKNPLPDTFECSYCETIYETNEKPFDCVRIWEKKTLSYRKCPICEWVTEYLSDK